MCNSPSPIIKTARLTLREWCDADLAPFALMNANPQVMEFFPALLSQKESDELAGRIVSKMREQSWGFWAVSIPSKADFIGFIGLAKTTFEAPFNPAVEIGWRLAPEYWGKGYATEGAKAVLAYAFQTLLLPEVVSFTAEQNGRSRRIMEKIGMHHHPQDDFEHPKLPLGHPLRKHVLYRLTAREWQTQNLEGKVKNE